MRNVISLIVNKNMCIGCGVCVNFCPTKVLKMQMNDSKNYEVCIKEGCIEKCDICLKICPFFNKNEDEINSNLYQNLPNFDKDIKKYIKTYEFYYKNDEKRISSASGGAGNFIFTKLFELDLIDYAVCVGGNKNELFKFQIFTKNNSKNIKQSAYYPLNLEDTLKFILENKARYAISSLPCFAKALRLAMKKSARLKNRIKFIIGLVCGQNKSANYTQKLANLAFKKDDVKLQNVNYRYKFKDKNAMEFGIKFTDINNKKAIDNRDKSAFLWWDSRAFTPIACNHCDDVFAKCADAVLMDAWLKENIQDFKGQSLVILRDKILLDIFENSNEFCKSVDPNRIVLSQIGVIKSKKLMKFGSLNPIKSKIRKIKMEIQKESLCNFECDSYVEKKAKKLKKLAKIDAKFETIKYLIKKYTKKVFA